MASETKRAAKAKRIVAYVDEGFYVEGKGYRVSLVVEGEDGHHPTGTWPYSGGVGEQLPWFWGPTFADARKAALSYNEQRGVSEQDAFKIVAESMGLGAPAGRRKGHSGKRAR